MHALAFETFGTPDVLSYRELPDPIVGPKDVQIALCAAGLNFADIYRRQGNYVLHGPPPYILGYEGAGEVVAVGDQVEALHVGDRIAFADVPFANATRVNVPEEHAIRLPDAITFETAAAMLLQGLTAQYLVNETAPVANGQTVLVHAAAGGVGLALTQLAKARGATVIALASSAEKRCLALEYGADRAFGHENWQRDVRTLAPSGVDVIFDSIGSTLSDSLAIARTRGVVVIYGMAGGNPDPIDPRRLMERSLTLKGGDLWNYLTSSAERAERAAGLFRAIESGALRLPPIHRFRMSDGAEAHRLLEGRGVIGKILYYI
ncbi:quinone oxidoreductase [Mesorhizobium sp. M0751]|uniref:quinone oxidoreductase family protein n=1 Tax=unclassified Mesorhizobium TaxID=325217 RepID=UPI003339466C